MSIFGSLLLFVGLPAVIAFFFRRRARLVLFVVGLVLAFACAQLSIGREDPIILFSLVGLGVSLGAVLAEGTTLVLRLQQRRNRMKRNAH